jgi:hypothetical protein
VRLVLGILVALALASPARALAPLTTSQPAAVYASCMVGNPDAAITDTPNDADQTCTMSICAESVNGAQPTPYPEEWWMGTDNGMVDILGYTDEQCDPATFGVLDPMLWFGARPARCVDQGAQPACWPRRLMWPEHSDVILARSPASLLKCAAGSLDSRASCSADSAPGATSGGSMTFPSARSRRRFRVHERIRFSTDPLSTPT